ncbi:MAG: class A beta-lactamase [Bacteroidota bacterium]
MKLFAFISAFMLLIGACSSGNNTASKEQLSSLDSLSEKINGIINSKKANIGVAIMSLEGKEMIAVNGDKKYIIMSVVKFPQAIYILHLVEEGKLSLTQPVSFTLDELKRDTHSPMRDERAGKAFILPLGEVLKYAVSVSDNIACDKLFDIGGGPAAVTKYFNEQNIKDFGLGSNYRNMNTDSLIKNWSTPNGMANILKRYYQGDFIKDSSKQLLWDIMVNSPSGPNRLKGQLPEGTIVAHKTGTFFDDSTNIKAINDVGIVQLPNGKHFAIVVFVNDSKETPEVNYATIAEICKVSWDYFIKQK